MQSINYSSIPFNPIAMNNFLKYKSNFVTFVLNVSATIVVISDGKNKTALANSFNRELLTLITEKIPNIKRRILNTKDTFFSKRFLLELKAIQSLLINKMSVTIFRMRARKK